MNVYTVDGCDLTDAIWRILGGQMPVSSTRSSHSAPIAVTQPSGKPRSVTVDSNKVESDLAFNGTYFPQAKNIVFNLKTEKRVSVTGKDGKKTSKTVPADYPMLTTVITFEDGTKSEVRNSKLDPINVIEKKLSDGTTVKVADDSSKERGIVYAVIKRLLSEASGKGYVGNSTQFAKSMKWLMDRSVDQNYVQAETKAQKVVRKAEASKTKPKTAQKQPKTRYTTDDIVQMLGSLLTKNRNAING